MLARGLSADFLRERAFGYLLPPALGAAVALAAGRLRRGPALWAVALVLLVPVQRIVEMGHFHRTIARDRFYPLVAPLDALPKEREPYRVAGVGWAMLPNSSAMWELEDIRGYQAITLGRLVQTRMLLGAPGVYLVYQPEKIDFPFADFLNVRFALFASEDAIPARWREVARSSTTVLAENPDALARARVPRFVTVGSDRGELATILAETTQFARSATIEPFEPPAPGTRVAAERIRNGPGRVETVREGTGFRLTTDLKRESWVTVAESAWKGWRAVIDTGDRGGVRELPLAYANHGYLGILVPEGRNEVRLFYRPRSFEIGSIVSGTAAALVLAVSGWARLRRRSALRDR
jgi:hypothetical protein